MSFTSPFSLEGQWSGARLPSSIPFPRGPPVAGFSSALLSHLSQLCPEAALATVPLPLGSRGRLDFSFRGQEGGVRAEDEGKGEAVSTQGQAPRGPTPAPRHRPPRGRNKPSYGLGRKGCLGTLGTKARTGASEPTGRGPTPSPVGPVWLLQTRAGSESPLDRAQTRV